MKQARIFRTITTPQAGGRRAPYWRQAVTASLIALVILSRGPDAGGLLMAAPVGTQMDGAAAGGAGGFGVPNQGETDPPLGMHTADLLVMKPLLVPDFNTGDGAVPDGRPAAPARGFDWAAPERPYGHESSGLAGMIRSGLPPFHDPAQAFIKNSLMDLGKYVAVPEPNRETILLEGSHSTQPVSLAANAGLDKAALTGLTASDETSNAGGGSSDEQGTSRPIASVNHQSLQDYLSIFTSESLWQLATAPFMIGLYALGLILWAAWRYVLSRRV